MRTFSHGAASFVKSGLDFVGITGKSGTKFGDYIIAIQIPFNSMATAGASEKYSVRNFFMPTGHSHKAWKKGATKSEPATTEFIDSWGNKVDFTGIKGAV